MNKVRKIEFNIGNIAIGGDNPVIIQTMCNTNTLDIDSSVNQCIDMINSGAQLIRLTTQGLKEVASLKEIKNSLRRKGFDTPIVADVHFNSQIAIESAKIVEKVRINPGNFAVVHKEAEGQFDKLIQTCKEYGTTIRIGLNHGSLGERITNKFGNTPLAMKEAVYEWINICKKHSFEKIVISLKASNTQVMSQAYKLLYRQMEEDGTIYPIHLGVTEAGNGDTGRIKSAIGIGTLLKENIGDTIRVSLTENPVNEIIAGKSIANFYQSAEWTDLKNLIEQQIKEKKKDSITLSYSDLYRDGFRKNADWNDFIIRLSCSVGTYLLENQIDDFKIENTPFSDVKISNLKDDILQGARRKFTHPEYIACPGCGRTQYNLEETFNRVREKTAHLKGVRIAVMGCIVNGPGEMADADYGYVGQGGKKVTIYKGRRPIYKGIDEKEAIDLLLQLIESDLSTKEKNT